MQWAVATWKRLAPAGVCLLLAASACGPVLAQDGAGPPFPALPGAPPAPPSTAAAASAALSAPVPSPAAIAVPRLRGRLTAADLGLVINTQDPYSVAVGEHYIAARGLAAAQVLRVSLPLRPNLDAAEFKALRDAINSHFGPAVQALALAWQQPYGVACNSLPGALLMGLDEGLCQRSCQPTAVSPYFNSASHRPFTEYGLRPAMLLAAPTLDEAKALVDRGVAADGSLLQPGRPWVQALFLTSNDVPRRVRTLLYPPPQRLPPRGVALRIEPEASLPAAPRLLLAITGSVKPPLLPAPGWVPGGLGDHLTSFGGALLANTGQGTALDWIASGATASHGTVSEPCNHLQKFPHPQLLLLHYLQGATALEAYWKSVAWPQQSLFIGEPLSAPFAAPFAAPFRPAQAAPKP